MNLLYRKHGEKLGTLWVYAGFHQLSWGNGNRNIET